MALKVLEVTGAAAVVILLLLIVPVLLRLRRTLEEVGQIITEAHPQAIDLLRKAQNTIDSVNNELETIEQITTESRVLISRIDEASEALRRAANSPMARIGFVSTSAAATGIALRRRIAKKSAEKE